MKENNEYEICHDFTSDYILEFAVDKELKNAAQEYQNLREGCGPAKYWEGLESLGTLRPFHHAECAALPVPSLILFRTEDDKNLQHSMIVYDMDAWVGANNLGSLGARDTYVHKYLNMSSRIYQYIVQGGWQDQDFHSISGDKYNMYYIPFEVNAAGANYNGRMRNDGCCCVI